MDKNPNINRFDINTQGGRKRKDTTSGTILHKLGLAIKVIVCLSFMFLGALLMVASVASYDMPELDIYIAQLINELVGIGITCLIYYFFLKAKVPNPYLRWTITIVLYFIVIWITDSLGDHFVLGVQLLTGFFGIITSIVLFLNVIRQFRDRVWFFRSLIWGIIYFLSGLDLILGFTTNIDFVFIFGFYILSFAFNIFWESFKSFFSFSSEKKGRSKTNDNPSYLYICISSNRIL